MGCNYWDKLGTRFEGPFWYWCGRWWVFFLRCLVVLRTRKQCLPTKNNITISSSRTTIEHQASRVGWDAFFENWCLFQLFGVMPRPSPVETFAPSCRRSWLVFCSDAFLKLFFCLGFTFFPGCSFASLAALVASSFFFGGGSFRFRWCKVGSEKSFRWSVEIPQEFAKNSRSPRDSPSYVARWRIFF